MRADRLVATLLLLQARGTVTAREVAEELEVSERTARRDLDALSVAGIPVFSRQGRGGGWELIGGARTDLTGLRAPEARALLTMAAATGHATHEFSSAMRKLVQALPEPMRADSAAVMNSVLADDTSWGNVEASISSEPRRDEWLEPLQDAVLAREKVLLTYATPRKGVSVRTIDPLGLVVKQGNWYLLAMTEAGQRSFRVDRIEGLSPVGERFELPADFDLAAAWESTTAGYLESSNRVTSRAIIERWAIPLLRALGVETSVHDDDGDSERCHATLGAWNSGVLAAQIAGVVNGIELIDPPPGLTERLASIGNELVSRFAHTADR
ncbi:MAG: helix-turn-helix transcriptional regulator [Ilumatobacter sp.]